MIEPLYEMDDFVPGPNNIYAFGWNYVDYSREQGSCVMQVVPNTTETLVHYLSESDVVALIIDPATNQIVGIQVENYDPKALR